MKIKKRAQAWGLDIIIASGLFMIALILFYFYAINYSNEAGKSYDDLIYQGNVVADTILSEGFPEDWTNSTVIVPGVLVEGRIDDSKLELFYNLTNNDYNRTLKLLNTNYNFFMNLSTGIVINGNYVDGIGTLSANPDNLIRIDRFIIYKDNPAVLSLYIWN
jgi:hypothetical protein